MMEGLSEIYNHIIYNMMDQRVRGWAMMGSPLPIILLLTSYVLFVKKIGPWWMRGRPACNVEKAMVIYNIVQMAINAHFFYNAMAHIWVPGYYNVICQGVLYDDTPNGKVVLNLFYWFFVSRVLDLLDTVFMVLKKSDHQATFLHVYHHLVVAGTAWFFSKYYPGGQLVFLGTINCFVHVVMYFYYFLTVYDVSYKRSIRWKKHITELQMGQFMVLVGQYILALFSTTCTYPRWAIVYFLSQVVTMLYLFGNFYNSAYVTKRNKKGKQP